MTGAPSPQDTPGGGRPYYQDDWLTVYHGDCREVMAGMEPESVHCVVTSPPYWGLRDYGTATWVGGDVVCNHAAAKKKTRYDYALDSSPIQQGSRTGTDAQVGAYLPTCPRCGATRQDSQLGLEPTPEEYVANLVAVFREVRRVLRVDGTVWLNLGDSYASAQGGANGVIYAPREGEFLTSQSDAHGTTHRARNRNGTPVPSGLKPKDLVGIPWRVAFALQADGWYLRSDIIWSKPNPMPESVTDRPTKSHEYIFLLSKSPRYYFDADAVREPSSYPDGPNAPASIASPYGQGFTRRAKIRGHERPHDGFNGKWDALTKAEQGANGRNIRSVWTMATQPYPGSHFATFPETLPERCIKAGCPEGGVVLDPFAGSGTTGMVAQSLSRRAVLIDLSLDYLDQLMARNADIPLGLGA